MQAVEEVWPAVVEPLEKLRTEMGERPDLPWAEHRENLWRELSAVAADPVVECLLGWLDELPESDRTSLVGSDDLFGYAYQAMAAADLAAGPAGEPAAGYDENAWFAYLAENGTRWDGTAGSWDAFREWFQYYAAEAGLGTPAQLFLDHLERMAPADRITLLAEYGVPIQAPEPAADPVDPRVRMIMDQVLAAEPEYADIPEARRIELVTAIIQERESAR